MNKEKEIVKIKNSFAKNLSGEDRRRLITELALLYMYVQEDGSEEEQLVVYTNFKYAGDGNDGIIPIS